MSNFLDLKKLLSRVDSLDKPDLDSSIRLVFSDAKNLITYSLDILISLESVYNKSSLEDRHVLDVLALEFDTLFDLIIDFELEKDESVLSAKNRALSILKSVRSVYADFREKIPYFLALKKEGLNDDHLRGFYKEVDTKKGVIEKTYDLAQRLDQNIHQRQSNLNIQIQKFNTDYQNRSAEISRIHGEIKSMSYAGVITKYAKIFSKRIYKDKKRADWFGGATIAATLVSIFGVLVLFGVINFDNKKNNQCNNIYCVSSQPIVSFEIYTNNHDVFEAGEKNSENTKDTSDIVSLYLTKITIILLIYFVLNNLIKNYNSNMRLYNLNVQRLNALKTFNVLHTNANKQDVRDAIVKQLSDLVFSFHDDGMLSKESKKISISDITNLIKAVNSKD